MLDCVAVGVVCKQVRLHPVEFVDYDTQVLGANRDFYVADSLDGLDEDHVVDYRADSADSFGKEHDLLPGSADHYLLYAFLDIAHLDLGGENFLSNGLAFDSCRLLEAGMDGPYRQGDVDDFLHFFAPFALRSVSAASLAFFSS